MQVVPWQLRQTHAMHRWPSDTRSRSAEVGDSDSSGASDYEDRDPLAWAPLAAQVVPQVVPQVVSPSSGKRKLGGLIANCKVVHTLCNVPWDRCYEASEQLNTMYEATLMLLKKHLAGTEELELLVPLIQHRIDGHRKHCMPAEQVRWDRAHALLRGKESVDWPKEMCATELLLFAAAYRVFEA